MPKQDIGSERIRIVQQASAVVIAYDERNSTALQGEIERLAELLDAYEDTLARREERRVANGGRRYAERPQS